MTGFIKTDKVYNFTYKAPIIDSIRTKLQKDGRSYLDIQKDGGPSASTLFSWFHGKTRRPQDPTVECALWVLGYHRVIEKLPRGFDVHQKLLGYKAIFRGRKKKKAKA